VIQESALTRNTAFNYRATGLATYLPKDPIQDRYLQLICKQAFNTSNLEFGIAARQLLSDPEESGRTEAFFSLIPSRIHTMECI
jgi:hypothetical protein